MFVRFRQTAWLQVSLIATHRVSGKVRHDHIASLGSVALAMGAAERITFWAKLVQRLDTLSNRIDAAQRGAILTEINARIPPPTAEDEEAAKNAGRVANAALFDALRDKHRMLADTYREGAAQQAAAAAAVDQLEAAHARRKMTPAAMRHLLRTIGWTAADLRHAEDLAALCDRWGEDRVIEMVVKAGMQAADRERHRAVRSLKRITALADGEA